MEHSREQGTGVKHTDSIQVTTAWQNPCGGTLWAYSHVMGETSPSARQLLSVLHQQLAGMAPAGDVQQGGGYVLHGYLP